MYKPYESSGVPTAERDTKVCSSLGTVVSTFTATNCTVNSLLTAAAEHRHLVSMHTY
jgi:hypothetical protein